jgi:signal transduction histidine kinase
LSLATYAQSENMRFIQHCDSIPDIQTALNRLDSLAKNGKLKPNEEIELYYKMGKHAMNLGQYSKVDYYSTRGLFIATKYRNYKNNGYFELMQATSSYIQGKLKESLSGFKRALDWAEKDKNIALQINVNNTYGGALVDLERYDEADKILKKGISLSKNNLEKHLPMYLLSSRILATSYERQKKLRKAKELFTEIELTARKYNDSYSLASILAHQADLLVKLKQNQEAKNKVNEALQIVMETKHSENIHSVLLHKADVLHAVGDFEDEVKVVREAYKYKLKAIDDKNSKQINELETKYKLQQLKNRKLEIEKKLKEENARRRQYALLFVSSLTIFILALFVIYFRNFRKKVKLESFYREQKIASILEGEENERTRIAKELHDGVVQDLTAIFHNMNLLKKLDGAEKNQKVEEISTYIKNASSDVRNLSHQMMPIALRENGLQVALDELFEKSLLPMAISYSIEVFGIEERLSQKIEISIYRIVQELINNLLKHSNANEVNCVLRKKDKFLTLIFEENGSGFDPNEVKHGIGLNSLKNRIDFLKGEINFESSSDSGLIAYVQIPI